ncbi:hypothetical protein RCL1_004722 [Eukaryota sp. TZLM3-RCL]
MLVFKDVFTDDELFSDSYRFSTQENGLIYEVVGDYVSINEDNEVVPAGSSEAVGTALNVVIDQGLEATTFDKKSFGAYLKMIFRNIKERLESKNPERVAAFQAAAAPFAKKLLENFKDLQFYTGNSMDPNGLVVFMDHKDFDGEEKPVFYVLKDAVFEQKY